MSGTLRRSPVQPKSCYLRRSGTHFTPRAQQVLAVARNDALLARALYSVAVDMWLPTRSPGKEPRRVLAQLSQLAEHFVFFRRLTTREGSSIQERGAKSACRGDLLSSRGKCFNYNVVL